MRQAYISDVVQGIKWGDMRYVRDIFMQLFFRETIYEPSVSFTEWPSSQSVVGYIYSTNVYLHKS